MERLYWADFVRALACVLVVILHGAGQFVPVGAPFGWLSLPALLEAGSRCAVPLFFMVSGYLWLRAPAELTGASLLKKITRSVVPLIFYSAIFLVLRPAIDLPLINPMQQPAFYHLWYLYVAPVVALMLMLFRPTASSSGMGATLSVCLLLLAAGGLSHVVAPHAFMVVTNAGVYFLYAAAGYFIAGLRGSSTATFLAVGVYVVATIGTAVLTNEASVIAGNLDQRFYQYDGTLIVIQASAMFYALRQIPDWISASKLVGLISAASLGVYGLHPLFLHFALAYFPRDIWGMALSISVAFALSLVGAVGIRMLPFGKRVA